MPEQELLRWLNQAALVVMAAAFLWLVRAVVNDIRHDLHVLRGNATETLEKLSHIEDLLARIERNGRPVRRE